MKGNREPVPQRMLGLIRRMPFTSAMVLLIGIVSAAAGLLDHPMDSGQLARWGFGWTDLTHGAFWRLLSAPLFILRPYMMISISAILLFFVGSCELLLKTRRTMVIFAVTHVAGYIGSLLLLKGLGGAGWTAAQNLAAQRDVGSSNGALGAAGAVLVFLPPGLRTIGVFLFGAYLLGSLLLEQRIWDVQHLVAFTTGFGLGVLFLSRDDKGLSGVRLSGDVLHRQRPLLISWLVGGTGVVNVLAAGILPHHQGLVHLEQLLPLGIPHAPRMALLFTGLFLLAVAGGLRRAQRTAWWIAFLLLLMTLVLQIHAGITKLEAVFALAFLLLMVAWKEDFSAASQSPSVAVIRITASILVLFVPLVSWLAVVTLRGQFPEYSGTLPAAMDVLRRLVYLPPVTLVPATQRGDWLLEAIPLAFWVGVVLQIVWLLRAVRAPQPQDTEMGMARRLALEHGRSGTAFMASRKGNSFFFSGGKQAFLAYRVHAGIAVVLGDPVGETRERSALIGEFVDFCEKNGWSMAIVGAGRDEQPIYLDAGLQLLKIGEEAMLDLADVEFKGKQWQRMRSSLNRARRKGIEFRLFEGGRLPAGIEAQLLEIDEEWHASLQLPPLEFTQGRVEDIRDPAVEVAVAVDATGRVHGYVDWLPVAAERGWVIDLLRRRPDAMQGTMEYLIGMSMLTFHEQGARFMSLATAPLADVDREEEQSLAPRLLGMIFERFQTFYNFRTLFDFKDHFSPRWEPVYLAYRDTTELPTIALAVLRAHLPDLGWAKLTQLLGHVLAERLRSQETETAP